MSTPLSVVYDAFLARLTSDEWSLTEELGLVERDWYELLKMAIARFKYPRVSLELEECSPAQLPDEPVDPHLIRGYHFKEDLTNDEIQLLALYMKGEWVKRSIASYENISSLYADKDFSQANLLDKLIKLNTDVSLEIHKQEGIYDRSREKRPADLFRKLAGKKNVV